MDISLPDEAAPFTFYERRQEARQKDEESPLSSSFFVCFPTCGLFMRHDKTGKPSCHRGNATCTDLELGGNEEVVLHQFLDCLVLWGHLHLHWVLERCTLELLHLETEEEEPNCISQKLSCHSHHIKVTCDTFCWSLEKVCEIQIISAVPLA